MFVSNNNNSDFTCYAITISLFLSCFLLTKMLFFCTTPIYTKNYHFLPFDGNQVVTMITTMSLIGLLPESRFRRFLGAIAYKIAIRTLMRSVSCVTNFHDTQYMPSSNGFCVANHTSPIDVGILSINTCFSLVGFFFSVLPALGLMCLFMYNV